MAENSAIEWTHHTFNAWIGCTKVGPGCDHCYAETLATTRLGVPWGPGAPRRRTASSTWSQPRRWNNRAARAGIRQRVFCSSLADVFDNEVPAEWRADLFQMIRETPALDWLLVTKRIGNVAKMADPLGGLPWNVWLGATIVNQAEADRDVPKLLATLASKRFLSMEPLLGPVDLSGVPAIGRAGWLCPLTGKHQLQPVHADHSGPCLDWIIVGGESGSEARPMHPDWARSLRDQCAAADVPFLFKQWGEWAPTSSADIYCHGAEKRERQFPGSPGIAWIADGRVCMRDFTVAEHAQRITAGEATCSRAIEVDRDALAAFHATLNDPKAAPVGFQWMYRVGKKAAGRLLDGVQHDGYPA